MKSRDWMGMIGMAVAAGVGVALGAYIFYLVFIGMFFGSPCCG